MSDFIRSYDLVLKIKDTIGEQGYFHIRTRIIDPIPTIKPSVIDLEIINTKTHHDALGLAKKILFNYYDYYFNIDTPTPKNIDNLLSQIDISPRIDFMQPLFYKKTGGIQQFVIYRAWGSQPRYPNEKAASVTFYEIPQHWDRSPVAQPAGIHAALIKSGIFPLLE